MKYTITIIIIVVVSIMLILKMAQYPSLTQLANTFIHSTLPDLRYLPIIIIINNNIVIIAILNFFSIIISIKNYLQLSAKKNWIELVALHSALVGYSVSGWVGKVLNYYVVLTWGLCACSLRKYSLTLWPLSRSKVSIYHHHHHLPRSGIIY